MTTKNHNEVRSIQGAMGTREREFQERERRHLPEHSEQWCMRADVSSPE